MFEKINKDFILNESTGANIKIIGVGGGGSNAVNKMSEDRMTGIDFYVANTDKQALRDSKINNKIILGENLTKGLGAGAYPEIGKKAAQESIDQIKEIVEGADLVFIAAAMGGGTGTGAAPVIAKAAKESGALVVGIVTTPFDFEGATRGVNAKEGLGELSAAVDSIIVVSNNRLLHELGAIPLTDSFQYADAILKQAVRTITDLITKHSLINLDFADIKSVLKDKGLALIGTGKSSGENAAVEAAIQAINSPILESSIQGATNAIVNVLGGPKALTINQAQEAVQTIKEASESNNINVIFGVTVNEEMGDEIVVSVIATGITEAKEQPTTGNSAINHAKSLFGDHLDIEKYRAEATIEATLNPADIPSAGKESREAASDETIEDIFSSLSLDSDEEENQDNVNIDDLLK